MQYDLFNQPKYKFFSLGSGSSGNCYYLGTREYGILIDAGVGIRNVKKTLREYGVSMEKINAILITHNHADHTKTIGALGQKMGIPVYATRGIHDAISYNKYLNVNLATSRRVIEKDVPFMVRDMQITAFDVPHDSIENVGFRIECNKDVFVLITDVGRITETIRHYASQATQLVMEANYDEDMLRTGSYPEHLKQRICCGMGHISNKQTADFLASIYNEKMNNIWLCHLSQDNNHPEIAYQTVAQALTDKGVIVGDDVKIEALSRYKASGLTEF